MELLEAIKMAYAANSAKAMHIDEIASHISGFADFKDMDLELLKSKISNKLSSQLKRKVKGKFVEDKESEFMRVPNGKKNSNGKKSFKSGVYALRPPKKEKPIINVDKNNKGNYVPNNEQTYSKGEQIDIPFEVNKVYDLYIGSAGEKAVASELLFRGFNVSAMTVDDGVDIIAIKGDKKYYVQVKTTTLKQGIFSVRIKKSSFERYSSGSCFYIIVIRTIQNNIATNIYIILSADNIRELIKDENIVENSSQMLTVALEQRNGTLYIKNKNISYFINSFDRIK